MDQTSNSWETWVQGVAGKVINSATDAQYSQPYEIQKLRLQALGNLGLYTEGQPTYLRTQNGMAVGGGTILLLGGALLLVMLLKKD